MSKKYTKEHEWIEKDGDEYCVGITDFAQEQLGDVVIVELPEVGQGLTLGEECAVIESVKAASDIYSPATGEVTAVNDKLVDDPALVNEEAEKGGWLWKMKINDTVDLEDLMDADAYATLLKENDE